MSLENTLTIYTDGASKGNPGNGGYGIYIEENALFFSIPTPIESKISAGYRLTTNNRMELMSVIEAMKLNRQFPNIQFHIYCDSKYVVDAVNKNWLFGWEKKNWHKIKNADLWKRFIRIYRETRPQLLWVKGHAGNKSNEICDRLASTAAKQPNLRIDEYYEQNIATKPELDGKF
jgi:ribonuclease HI